MKFLKKYWWIILIILMIGGIIYFISSRGIEQTSLEVITHAYTGGTIPK